MGSVVRNTAGGGANDEIIAKYSVTLDPREDQNPIHGRARGDSDGIAMHARGHHSKRSHGRDSSLARSPSVRSEHVERLRKKNNRGKMMWIPSRDDDLTIGREAKRQAQSRMHPAIAAIPGSLHSDQTGGSASASATDRVGGYSKRIDRALPGKHTIALYDSLKRREADY
ncbi:hypothetical protein FOQG_17465 [Fusarium oxysporum f. sp. raphani 54005]|uniref:Uncharacterized protein n=2 Tax=Fusarium oxysporum f. sp. raphani TaxID=96318 RepID=X0B6T0_FUSOX|nr:hypothetical protein FOQG_17465 [Fusarium oxysporum f. sp. raphani 54005]KAG7418731.1 hypothetical protein Forpi1262_v016461 [Fusarium oxysporum f. sp. raphani]